MNGSAAQNAAVIWTLIGTSIASLLTLIGVLYTAARKAKSEDAAAKLQKESKTEEASATVRVALVNDRDSFETRLLTRVDALQKQVDEERKARQDAEDKAREERAKFTAQLEEYKHKFSDLQHTVERLQTEKVLQSKDYQEKITEQDTMNHRLQDELKEVREKYDKLEKEYEELLKICNELRAQLAEARGQAVESVLTMAKNIGVAEVPPPKREGQKP